MTNESPTTFCVYCGQNLPPDATFCPNCGQKADTASNAPAPDASRQADHDGGAPDKIESYLNYAIIITVLAVFNCGSVINLALGIIAIVYASKVDQHLLSGNRKEAEACAQTARTLCFIATGVIVLQILLVLFVLFAIMFCAVLPIVFQ